MTNTFIRDYGLSQRPHAESVPPNNSVGNGTTRVILVTVRNDLLPPIFYGPDPLQWMRAIMVGPGKMAKFCPPDFVHNAPPEAFTPLPSAASVRGEVSFSPRLVQGDILRDETGHLYEKIGSHIRPLRKLMSGPRGEILELARAEPENFRAKTPLQNSTASNSAEIPDKRRPAGEEREPLVEPPSPSNNRPAPPPVRKLFPDLGVQRFVPWGDFKSMLTPQPAHPERLHDAHRLACCVQVYEVTASLRLESLAALVLGDVEKINQLHLLTTDLANKLQLEALQQRRARVPAEIRREPGMLLPYDFIFQLQLAQDPTRDHVTPDHAQQRAPSTPPLPLAGQPFTPVTESSNGASPHAAMAQPAPAGAQKLSPKNEIPRQFVQPHEFRLSREEVLYDLRLEALPKGLLTSLLRRLKKMFAGRAEFRKWQALLNGKNLEEQLWTVRPPKGMLSHPAIREWARQTLAQASYDLQTMLLEWEIFWRRKGL